MEMRDVDLTTASQRALGIYSLSPCVLGATFCICKLPPLYQLPFFFFPEKNNFTRPEECHCTNYELSIKGYFHLHLNHDSIYCPTRNQFSSRCPPADNHSHSHHHLWTRRVW